MRSHQLISVAWSAVSTMATTAALARAARVNNEEAQSLPSSSSLILRETIDSNLVEIIDHHSHSHSHRHSDRHLAATSCDTAQSKLTLELTTDESPSETSWKLVQLDSIYYDVLVGAAASSDSDAAGLTGNQRGGRVIARGPSRSSSSSTSAAGGDDGSDAAEIEFYAPSTSYTGSVCLDGGYIYVLVFKDSAQNGFNATANANAGFEFAVVGNVTAISPAPSSSQSSEEVHWEVYGSDAMDFKFKNFEFVVHPIDIPEQEQETTTTTTTSTTSSTVANANPTTQPTNKPVQEGPETVVSFIVMADIPYYTNHRYCLNKQLREINPTKDGEFLFLVHLGDMKSGQTRNCEKEIFSDVAEIFSHSSNTLHYDPRDVFFLIGDNDWTDCNDPDQAFSYWMNHFGNGKKTNGLNTGPNQYGFGTFSRADMEVEWDYQGNQASSTKYPTSASNFAFYKDQVLFVGINQVGGGSEGDESERVANNFDWVKYQLDWYADRDMMRTLVVFAHAPMSGARYEYFGGPFQRYLRNNYPDFLVVYIHGDGHEFYVDRVDSNNRNLLQIEIDSGDIADPIMVSITRDPSRKMDKLVIDRRGGRYDGEDCNPGNRDQTWSSTSW